jgi:predicted Zn-dependent protease
MKISTFLKNILSARLLFVFILLMLLQACATNPVTNKMELMLVSENKEFDIGKGVDKQVREDMGVYLEKPELRNMLKEMVENIGKKVIVPTSYTVPKLLIHRILTPSRFRAVLFMFTGDFSKE